MKKIIMFIILFISCSVFAEEADGFSMPGLDGFKTSNEPTIITSNNLSLDTKSRIFTYTGNVKAIQGDLTLTSEELEGYYDEKNQITQIIAKRNVVITKGPDTTATGGKGVYTAKDRTIVLTQSPTLEQKGSKLESDVVTVFLDENRSEASGTVRVKLVKAPEEVKK